MSQDYRINDREWTTIIACRFSNVFPVGRSLTKFLSPRRQRPMVGVVCMIDEQMECRAGCPRYSRYVGHESIPDESGQQGVKTTDGEPG
jgi:hypothetical protein